MKAVRPDRDALEIRFPRVEGYRIELPEERLTADFNEDSILELSPDLVGPSITRNTGIIGEGVDMSLEHLGDMRPSTLVFYVTQRLLYTKWRDPGEEPGKSPAKLAPGRDRHDLEGRVRASCVAHEGSPSYNPVPALTARCVVWNAPGIASEW